MRAIFIDPGETVGWCTARVWPATRGRGVMLDDDTLPPPGGRPRLEVISYDNTKLKRLALTLLKRAQDYDVVGFETYNIRPDMLRAHAGSDVPTLQLIGMIRLACWDAQTKRVDGGPAIVTQPPTAQSMGAGAAKLYFDDLTLAALADADAGAHDDGHYGSALKHLAAWYHDTYGKASS